MSSRSKYFLTLENDFTDLGDIEDVLKVPVWQCSVFIRWVYRQYRSCEECFNDEMGIQSRMSSLDRVLGDVYMRSTQKIEAPL
jgi:hypothetical protein